MPTKQLPGVDIKGQLSYAVYQTWDYRETTGVTIALPPELFEKVTEWARKQGFLSEDEFVAWAVEDKLRELSKAYVDDITGQVRRSLEAQGISEAEIQEDFERFCRGLPDRG